MHYGCYLFFVTMNQRSSQFTLFYAVSLGTQLGFLVVAPVLGFLLLGRWLDAHIGTTPFIMLGGITAGIVVTGYEIYHIIYPLLYPDTNHDTNRT